MRIAQKFMSFNLVNLEHNRPLIMFKFLFAISKVENIKHLGCLKALRHYEKAELKSNNKKKRTQKYTAKHGNKPH